MGKRKGKEQELPPKDEVRIFRRIGIEGNEEKVRPILIVRPINR